MSEQQTAADVGKSAVERLVVWLRALRLKRRARKHYVAYHELQDRYSCGNKMIDELTGGKLGHHRNMFNILMDQLALIDPETPEGRLT